MAEKARPRSELFTEPFRDVLPSSYSMINLHANNYAAEEYWEERGATALTPHTGVIGNGTTSCKGGGGSKHLKLPRNKHNFQPRYGNFLHPDYALLYPSNACQEETYSEDEEEANGPRGILTADNYNRRNTTVGICTTYQPAVITESSKLCLCEDVLQPKEAPRRSLDWGYAEKGVFLDRSKARMSPRRSYSDPKPCSLTKRIVSDVTSCCLGVVPESDASVNEDEPQTTKDKSVMTEESSFRRSYSVDAVKFRTSCPLTPPKNELCECEKKIKSGAEPATKVLYQNGTDVERPVVPVPPEPKSALPAELIRDIVTMNEQYQQHNLKRLLSNFRSLGDMAPFKDAVDVSRRSSSDISLYHRNSMIAECTKCGNKFDIRGKYFGGSVVENVTTSSSSSNTTDTDTTSSEKSPRDDSDKDRKLTKEERENILKELEDIISGNFFQMEATAKKTGASSFPSSMLHLDLNTLKDSDTSVSEGSLQVSNFSSITDSNDFRTGRVAELARHFSKLGEAGIIRGAEPKTKSVPNLIRYQYEASKPHRSSSMEELDRKGVVLTEIPDEPEHRSSLEKRRQSFARQNTVFCKMKSVDELDLKNRNPRRLYKYASLADFRMCKSVKADDRKKVVSFDDLSQRRRELQEKKPDQKKEFNLETFLAKNKPYEENLKINYDQMTTAIRDYLANKELLLKRMKSNSIDQYNTKSCSLSNLNRACANFTTIREATSDPDPSVRNLKMGMSVDALYFSGICSPPQENLDNDDFTYKSNLRRVYKGSYFKGRRFRRCRKLENRRSFLVYPAENINRFRVTEEVKREMFDKHRCQSLDTGMEAPRRQDLQRSHKL